jgi:Tol biopolymer transport system component/DNA-binding winged helix-turn-helix (wHTH) protein
VAREFQIGSFRISPDLNRVESSCDDSKPVQLEPKIMDVLVCLHDASGEVVSRQQILLTVWGETVVGDDVLTRAVGHLRRIMGDDPRQPRFIETIPRRGYRLLAAEPPVYEQSPAKKESDTATLSSDSRRRFRWPLAVVLVVGALLTIGFQQKFAVADRVVMPTRVFPVTSLAGKEVDPAVSPDGSQVAFAARLGESGRVNIHIQDLQTGQSRQLTFGDTDMRHPAWSPDGLSIAYISEGDDCGLMVVAAEGGIERRIASCGHIEEHAIAWTHDSGSLIYPRSEEPGAPAGLVVLDLATGATRWLTQPSADHAGDFDPAVSALDGTVAFNRVRAGGAQDIYVVPLSGGEPVQLTFDNQVLTGLAWSEDGRHIIYSSHRAGLFNLWRVRADGGLPQLVLGGGDKIKDPSTARQVSMVAFENWIYETNIWRLPLSAPDSGRSRRPELFIHSTQWDLQPDYSPDGQFVAFVSTRTGGGQIWLADADGRRPRRLTNFEDSRVGSPRWSPDGTRLTFTILTGGQSDIYVMPVDGGAGFNVTSDSLDDLSPSWAADGQSVYFASRRSGAWQVWRVELDGGGLQQVTSDGGLVARESRDGQLLYFTRSDRVGLWEMPTAGGQNRQALTDLALWEAGNWAVADEGIYYVESDSSGQQGISHWDRRSRRTTRLVTADSLSGQGLSVSPDGNWLAFSRFDRAECDILAVEGLR